MVHGVQRLQCTGSLDKSNGRRARGKIYSLIVVRVYIICIYVYLHTIARNSSDEGNYKRDNARRNSRDCVYCVTGSFATGVCVCVRNFQVLPEMMDIS